MGWGGKDKGVKAKKTCEDAIKRDFGVDLPYLLGKKYFKTDGSDELEMLFYS